MNVMIPSAVRLPEPAETICSAISATVSGTSSEMRSSTSFSITEMRSNIVSMKKVKTRIGMSENIAAKREHRRQAIRVVVDVVAHEPARPVALPRSMIGSSPRLDWSNPRSNSHHAIVCSVSPRHSRSGHHRSGCVRDGKPVTAAVSFDPA